MVDNPRVYPFKRITEEVEKQDYMGKKRSTLKDLWKIWQRKSPAEYLRILIMSTVAFFLARAQILGGLYPFAPAFLAAAAVIYPRRGVFYALPIVLGLFSAINDSMFYVYTAITVILAVVFLLYNVDSKKQWFVVPGMVIAAVMVSLGMNMAITSFSSYRFLIAIFESVLAGGLSLVFMVVLSAVRRFDVARRFSMDETVCIFIASMGVLCGFSGLHIGVFEAQTIMSRFLIMAVAFLGGGGAGAALGALVGIVPSLSAVIAPTIIATYSFSGLLAGVFSNFGRIGTAMGFLLGNLILVLYFFNSVEISVYLLSSMMAAILFLVLPKKLYNSLHRAFSANGLKGAKEEKNERLLRMAVRRLRNCGWLFRDLSNSLTQVAGQDELSEEDIIRSSMEQLSHQLCCQCSMRDICWDLDYQESFLGMVTLFEAVRDNGVAEAKDAPENFTKRCPHIKELVAVVNCLYDMNCREGFWQAQRQNSRRLLSMQLAGASEVLEKIAHEITEFGEEREVLERELQRAIAKRGMPVESAGISAITDKSIDLWCQYIECPGEAYCRHAIEEEVERLLSYDFFVYDNCCGGPDCSSRCRYRLLATGAYSLTVGQAQLARDGKGVCGDSNGSVLLDEGKHLLMISDGMGSGEKAAAESGAAVTLVSRLLEAGFVRDTAIDVVNAALSLRGKEESFVTLDICMVDLYSGVAEFIKTGGSISFIRRGGTVKVIKGSSLPVGVMYNVEKEIIKEQVTTGDMIIMASDGLLDTDSNNDGQWLGRIIEQAPVSTPQGMAEYLLDKVISVSGGKVNDDITVIVAQLGRAA